MLKFFSLITSKVILPCFLLVAIESTPKAQERMVMNDTIRDNLIAASFSDTHAKLFIHYDKTIYVPNEMVWFTAYLLNSDTANVKPTILSVVLVNNSDRSIASQKKFVFERTTSSGNFVVPDSIAEGYYSIIAYANHLINGRPDIQYTQHIAIKRPELTQEKNRPDKKSSPVFSTADSAKINVRFYPEGGNLVENLPAYVGWEAKDGTGASLKLRALLMENDNPVDTIVTSDLGTGRIFVNPKSGIKYTLKIIGRGSGDQFDLPPPLKSGIAVNIHTALAEDTLLMKVTSTFPGKVDIVVHNSRQVFFRLTDIDPAKKSIFRIALVSLPRGLAAVTIYNEKREPCAERVFFAHYNQSQVATVATDIQQYGKRQKVTLKLNLKPANVSSAMVSIACVQSGRIDKRLFNNIDNYGFLSDEMNAIPALFNDNKARKNQYLEDVLLIKGWRRYSGNGSHFEKQDAITQFTGVVKVNGKKAKKPMALTLMGNSNVFFINTDKYGNFNIPRKDLVIADDKVFAFFATGDDAFTTRINFNDPFMQINQSVAAVAPLFSPQVSFTGKFIDARYLAAPNNIQLNEVKIKGTAIDERYNALAKPGMHKNACGDYICMVGALNCPYPGHLYATSVPIKGHRYIRHVGERHDDSPFIIMANVPFVYEGCDTKNHSLIRFDGINTSKEYYPYTKNDTDNSGPLYNTTLYWAGCVELIKGQEKQISFYTGDVSGKFSVIMQGITPGGVVYDEGSFEVAK